jgi:hypothetical protein
MNVVAHTTRDFCNIRAARQQKRNKEEKNKSSACSIRQHRCLVFCKISKRLDAKATKTFLFFGAKRVDGKKCFNFMVLDLFVGIFWLLKVLKVPVQWITTVETSRRHGRLCWVTTAIPTLRLTASRWTCTSRKAFPSTGDVATFDTFFLVREEEEIF